MARTGRLLVVVLGGVFLAGCGSGSKAVPVKGTLTIDGQAASNIQITFSPVDKSLPEASGQVTNGSFELRSGAQGDVGAMPGKYKVVLKSLGPSLQDAMAAMKPGGGGAAPQGQPGAADKPPFPEKYSNAGTSDKEVEVTSGSNDIKIDITSS